MIVERGILVIALILACRDGDLGLDRAEAAVAVADRRQVERHPLGAEAEAAQACRGLAAELAGRLLGDEVDRAADGVLAVERTLRAAQHFDTLEIDKVEGGTGRFRHRHAVDIDADRLVARETGVRRRREAADGDQRAEGVADRLVDLDVRDRVTDVADGLDARALERLGAERRHRDRHVLQLLLAALGGDDDLVAVFDDDDVGARRGRACRGSCFLRRERRGADGRGAGQQKGEMF